MKTEILSYRKSILPNTEQYLKERIKYNGQVTEVRIRFYPGVEKALQIKPYVLHKGNRAEDVFTYVVGTDSFLTGDDDNLVFPVSVDLELDDEFVVYVKNTDLTNSYSLVVDVKIEYFFGE